MDDSLFLYIFLSVIGLVALAVALYYLAMYLKGRIILTVPEGWTEPGERLSGTIKLEAKKPINARAITATLQCDLYIEERYRDAQHKSRTRTHTVTLHQEVIPLSKERNIPAGQFQYFDFSFTIPNELPNQDDSLRELTAKHFGVVGEALMDLSRLGNRRRVSWCVEIRVDAEGIDLTKSKDVKVNLKPDNTVFY